MRTTSDIGELAVLVTSVHEIELWIHWSTKDFFTVLVMHQILKKAVLRKLWSPKDKVMGNMFWHHLPCFTGTLGEQGINESPVMIPEPSSAQLGEIISLFYFCQSASIGTSSHVCGAKCFWYHFMVRHHFRYLALHAVTKIISLLRFAFKLRSF